MTHISDPYTHPTCRLIQSAFVYNGECSICATENKDVFSLHQIPKEEYDEIQHGPVINKDHFQGVYKDVEVPVISDEKTHTVSSKVFHQVAFNSSGIRWVFSPMHSACAECINLMKRTTNCFKCHICRFEITKEKMLSKIRGEHNPLTMSRIRVESNRRVYQRVCRIADFEDEIYFSTLSKSQKKSYTSHIKSNIETIGITRYLEEESNEDNDVEVYSSQAAATQTTNISSESLSVDTTLNRTLAELIDFENLPRMKRKKKKHLFRVPPIKINTKEKKKENLDI